jgi:hypothetical protein
MDDQITGLLERASGERRLELAVRIYDGDSFAPLGADLEQLEKVLFVAGTAEFIYSYVAYLAGSNEQLPYEIGSFREFEGALSSTSRGVRPSWDDLHRDRRDYEAIFRRQLYMRTGGLWSVGSSDLLRMELVEIYKQNPTILKILATGVVAIMITLSGCVGGVWIAQERDADHCRVEQIAYGKQLAETIMRQAKLEGKFTPEHGKALAQVQDTVNAGIAACGCHLTGVRIEIDPKAGKVIFEIGAPSPARKET